MEKRHHNDINPLFIFGIKPLKIPIEIDLQNILEYNFFAMRINWSYENSENINLDQFEVVECILPPPTMTMSNLQMWACHRMAGILHLTIFNSQQDNQLVSHALHLKVGEMKN